MSAKSALRAQLSRRDGNLFLTKVPSRMRPNAKSIEKMGNEVSAQLAANEAMRNRSKNAAAQQFIM